MKHYEAERPTHTSIQTFTEYDDVRSLMLDMHRISQSHHIRFELKGGGDKFNMALDTRQINCLQNLQASKKIDLEVRKHPSLGGTANWYYIRLIRLHDAEAWAELDPILSVSFKTK